MKKFRFKGRKNASVRMLIEPKPGKKRFNIDRILFWGIIAVALFFLLRFFYRKMFLVVVDGQVTYDKVDVSFTDDVRLGAIKVQEGDTIKKGDTLFFYQERKEEDQQTLSRWREVEDRDQLSLKIHDVEGEIYLKENELFLIKEELDEKIQDLNKKRDLVLLDAISKKEYQEALLLVEQLRRQRRLLKIEHRVLKRKWEGLQNALGSLGLGELNLNFFQAYIAPIEGVTGQILFNPNEVCYHQQHVLTIHQPDSLQIVAYFSPRQADLIYKGMQLKVVFPDGTVSKGEIRNIFVSTYELPSEFQKRYEPTTRSLVAIIVPMDRESHLYWRRFYKIGVEIQINKILHSLGK